MPIPTTSQAKARPRWRLGTTVCTRGYTATVRPPVNVTEKIKRDQMAAYGLTGQPLSAFELDHLEALELGGAPDDVANLWPQEYEKLNVTLSV